MKAERIVALFAVALAGCSTLPSPDKMAALPVVEWGQPAPAHAFVLHIPAGKPVTAQASIQGNLFSKSDEKTLEVMLAKDLYVYQDYVSRDGMNWQKSSDVLATSIRVQLPGTEHPGPGAILLTLDERKH